MEPKTLLLLIVHGVQGNNEVVGYFVAESIRDAVPVQPDVTVTSVQVLGVVGAFTLVPYQRGLGATQGGYASGVFFAIQEHKAEKAGREWAEREEAKDKAAQDDE